MKRQLVRLGFVIGTWALAACAGPTSAKTPETPASPAGADEAREATPSAAGDATAAESSSSDVRAGIAALKAGDLNGARAAFEVAIQKNPKQADAYHYLGVVHDQVGERADAEKSYRRALELSPGLEESAINLAAILIENRQFDEAASLMKKAVAADPKSAALQLNLAMALSGKGDVAGADAAFEEAIRLEPNSGIHLVTYASHLARNGKKTAAVARLVQAEQVSKRDAGVLASVALEYKGLKDFKKCVAVLDKAVGLRDVAELRIYRGACKLGLKDLSGATTEFRDAVAREPNNALAHYSLGNALADGGKLDEAIAEWEACRKLAPDGPQAKAAEKKIALAKARAKAKK